MHTAQGTNAFVAELSRRIARAEARQNQSRTDAEFEANRQVVIWLQSQLETIGRRAA